ncbi:hypothetical protein ACFPTX_16245 [Pseudomonas sp. GCM10022188]|uniref:hypothetical protein n=1 Tax=Pseudomonas TaxID=286 RepID=UPI001E381639|nr:hypothetical protein [Pseudomonas oryzagri]MCC6076076.1 hypothetical protein [Pseudomonas oryzagri]
MHNLSEIHLKPEILARYGLPDIPYPVPLGDLQAARLFALKMGAAEPSGNAWLFQSVIGCNECGWVTCFYCLVIFICNLMAQELEF